MRAERKRVALFHELHLLYRVSAEKLRDHYRGFVVADDRRLRMAQQKLRERGGMIRLHVVDDHIIERPSVQLVFEIFKKQAAYRLVHGVEKRGLFIAQQIGVIGNARRDGIYALKHGEPPVIGADPDKIRRDFLCTVHILPPYVL